MGQFTISSALGVDRCTLWDRVIQPAGINSELGPIFRMTFPSGMEDVTSEWRRGERQFRSWLLLGGFLPVDYDDVSFHEVIPGHCFHERSKLLSQKVWEHERSIVDIAGGCQITDDIRFTPRLRLLGSIYAIIFRFVFRWRHRKLRRRYRSLG